MEGAALDTGQLEVSGSMGQVIFSLLDITSQCNYNVITSYREEIPYEDSFSSHW
jgi:hypothetical protein